MPVIQATVMPGASSARLFQSAVPQSTASLDGAADGPFCAYYAEQGPGCNARRCVNELSRNLVWRTNIIHKRVIQLNIPQWAKGQRLTTKMTRCHTPSFWVFFGFSSHSPRSTHANIYIYSTMLDPPPNKHSRTKQECVRYISSNTLK